MIERCVSHRPLRSPISDREPSLKSDQWILSPVRSPAGPPAARMVAGLRCGPTVVFSPLSAPHVASFSCSVRALDLGLTVRIFRGAFYVERRFAGSSGLFSSNVLRLLVDLFLKLNIFHCLFQLL